MRLEGISWPTDEADTSDNEIPSPTGASPPPEVKPSWFALIT